MRFQQLKRDPNAIMRKKLYKSGKNWVVKSTLAFVGGAVLLGTSTFNTVKADATNTVTATDTATTHSATNADGTTSNLSNNDKTLQQTSNVADTFNYTINYVAVGGSQDGQILKTVTGTNGTDGESVAVQSLQDMGLTPDGYDVTEVYSDNSLSTVSASLTLKSGQDSYDVYVKSSAVSKPEAEVQITPASLATPSADEIKTEEPTEADTASDTTKATVTANTDDSTSTKSVSDVSNDYRVLTVNRTDASGRVLSPTEINVPLKPTEDSYFDTFSSIHNLSWTDVDWSKTKLNGNVVEAPSDDSLTTYISNLVSDPGSLPTSGTTLDVVYKTNALSYTIEFRGGREQEIFYSDPTERYGMSGDNVAINDSLNTFGVFRAGYAADAGNYSIYLDSNQTTPYVIDVPELNYYRITLDQTNTDGTRRVSLATINVPMYGAINPDELESELDKVDDDGVDWTNTTLAGNLVSNPDNLSLKDFVRKIVMSKSAESLALADHVTSTSDDLALKGNNILDVNPSNYVHYFLYYNFDGASSEDNFVDEIADDHIAPVGTIITSEDMPVLHYSDMEPAKGWSVPGYSLYVPKNAKFTILKGKTEYTIDIPKITAPYFKATIEQQDKNGKKIKDDVNVDIPIYAGHSSIYDIHSSDLFSNGKLRLSDSTYSDSKGTDQSLIQEDSSITDQSDAIKFINSKIDEYYIMSRTLARDHATDHDNDGTVFSMNLVLKYDPSPITVNIDETDPASTGDSQDSSFDIPYNSSTDTSGWTSKVTDKPVDWANSSYEVKNSNGTTQTVSLDNVANGTSLNDYMSDFVKNTILGSETTNAADAGKTYTFDINYAAKMNYTIHYILEGQTNDITDTGSDYVGSTLHPQTLNEMDKVVPKYAANIVNVNSGSTILKKDVHDYYVTVPATLDEDFAEVKINQQDKEKNPIPNSEAFDIHIPLYDGNTVLLDDDVLNTNAVKNYKLDLDASTVTVPNGDDYDSVAISNGMNIMKIPVDAANIVKFINELAIVTSFRQSGRAKIDLRYDTKKNHYMYTFNLVYAPKTATYNVRYVYKDADGKVRELYKDPADHTSDVGQPVETKTLGKFGPDAVKSGYAAGNVDTTQVVSESDGEKITYDINVPTVDDYYTLTIKGKDSNGADVSETVSVPRYGSASASDIQTAVDKFSTDHLDWKSMGIDNQTSLLDYVSGLIAEENTDSAELIKNANATTDTTPATTNQTLNLAYKEQVTYTVNYVAADDNPTILYSDRVTHTGDVGDPIEVTPLGKNVKPGYAATSIGAVPNIIADKDTYDIQVPTVDDYYKLTINGKDADGKDFSTSISIPRYGSVVDTTVQKAIDSLSSEHIDLSNLKLNNETISNPTSLGSYIKNLINKENVDSINLAKNVSTTTDTQPTINQTLDVGYKEQVIYTVNYVAKNDITKVLYSNKDTQTGDVGDPVEVAPLETHAQPGYAAGSVDTTQKVVSGQKTYNISVPKVDDYYKLTINGNGKSEEISIPKYGNTADKDVQDTVSALSNQDVDWSNVKIGNTIVKSLDDLVKYVADKGNESKNLTPDSDSDDLATTDETLNLSYLAPKVNYTVNYVTSDGTTIYSDKSQAGRVGDKVTLPTITQLVKTGTLNSKVASHKADSPATITLTDNDTYTVSIPTISDYLTLNINQTDSNKKPLTTVSANVPMYGQTSTDVKGLSDKKVDWNNSTVDGKKLSDLVNTYGLSTDTANLSDLVKAILTDANEKSALFATDTNEDDSKAGNVMDLNVQYKADENNDSGNNTGSNTDESNNNGESDIVTIVKKSQDVATTTKVVTLYNVKGEIVRNRALAVNSGWYSDEEYTLNGVKYYRVATGEFAKASDVYVYEPMKKSYIKVYDDQIGDLINYLGDSVKNRSLAPSSEWVTDRYALINGNKYYRVATSEFAKLDQVYLYQYTDKVVRTNSNIVPVYDERGNKLNETLPANASYRADRIVTINGQQYYRVAVDKFVKFSDAY
ncbi:KxYKxGKxW signal peptide domain-containing protein [Companilactobacillus hulinensis]|uniref:KxYKxGKxW signal peptide domain-containing protein n=1 Tax=Companilactobacillus hulinensis TaxID=2486007 RepID=UPI000F774713|nr:KxYKxGKxW signal peptide domain-containing protein [Companilactobacillus hulinensis]